MSVVLLLVAAGRLANRRKADDERDLQSLPRRRFAATSVTATHSRPEHSQLDTIGTLLDSVQRLVHDSTSRHTVHVVWRPRPSTEPHYTRWTAPDQSSHGTTQRSCGGPASQWLARYSVESGQQQPQPPTLNSTKQVITTHSKFTKARRRSLTEVHCNGCSWPSWELTTGLYSEGRRRQCAPTADHYSWDGLLKLYQISSRHLLSIH